MNMIKVLLVICDVILNISNILFMIINYHAYIHTPRNERKKSTIIYLMIDTIIVLLLITSGIMDIISPGKVSLTIYSNAVMSFSIALRLLIRQANYRRPIYIIANIMMGVALVGMLLLLTFIFLLPFPY